MTTHPPTFGTFFIQVDAPFEQVLFAWVCDKGFKLRLQCHSVVSSSQATCTCNCIYTVVCKLRLQCHSVVSSSQATCKCM